MQDVFAHPAFSIPILILAGARTALARLIYAALRATQKSVANCSPRDKEATSLNPKRLNLLAYLLGGTRTHGSWRDVTLVR